MNSITIVGNLTRDPELKILDNAQCVAKFTLAVSRLKQDRSEETSFFNVVAFGSLAENVMDSLHKGNRAIVVGRHDQRSWETDNGEKKTVFEITATAVAAELRFHTAQIKPGVSGGAASRPASSGFKASEEDAF